MCTLYLPSGQRGKKDQARKLFGWLALVMVLPLTTCTSEMKPGSLQSEIETILAEYPEAEVSVSIRDSSGDLSLDINGDIVMHAASTMKIAVMIELYRQAHAGRFSLDDSLDIKNRFTSIFDGSTYSIDEDSDSTIYSLLGNRMTIKDLIYRLITSSSNLATNILIELVSPDSVQATIERLGTQRMEVLRGVQDLKAFDAGMNNTTTASDLAVLLEALRDGKAVSPDASAEMIDIMSDVPGWLIRAAPESRIAHKTGMITAHHHDAAIIYPHTANPYVLVILTRGITDESTATELGHSISDVVSRHLRGGSDPDGER